MKISGNWVFPGKVPDPEKTRRLAPARTSSEKPNDIELMIAARKAIRMRDLDTAYRNLMRFSDQEYIAPIMEWIDSWLDADSLDKLRWDEDGLNAAYDKMTNWLRVLQADPEDEYVPDSVDDEERKKRHKDKLDQWPKLGIMMTLGPDEFFRKYQSMVDDWYKRDKEYVAEIDTPKKAQEFEWSIDRFKKEIERNVVNPAYPPEYQFPELVKYVEELGQGLLESIEGPTMEPYYDAIDAAYNNAFKVVSKYVDGLTMAQLADPFNENGYACRADILRNLDKYVESGMTPEELYNKSIDVIVGGWVGFKKALEPGELYALKVQPGKGIPFPREERPGQQPKEIRDKWKVDGEDDTPGLKWRQSMTGSSYGLTNPNIIIKMKEFVLGKISFEDMKAFISLGYGAKGREHGFYDTTPFANMNMYADTPEELRDYILDLDRRYPEYFSNEVAATLPPGERPYKYKDDRELDDEVYRNQRHDEFLKKWPKLTRNLDINEISQDKRFALVPVQNILAHHQENPDAYDRRTWQEQSSVSEDLMQFKGYQIGYGEGWIKVDSPITYVIVLRSGYKDVAWENAIGAVTQNGTIYPNETNHPRFMWHITHSFNRQSIQQHGLVSSDDDLNENPATMGTEDRDGVFLFPDPDDMWGWISNIAHPGHLDEDYNYTDSFDIWDDPSKEVEFDMWKVDTTGLFVYHHYLGEDIWIAPDQIPPNRLQLAHTTTAGQRGVKLGNILDPIHDELDQRVFDGIDPKLDFFEDHLHHVKEVFRQNGYDIHAFSFFLTGSICTYQYSETSDCDVTIICDYDEFSEIDRSDLVQIVTSSLDGTYFPGTPYPYQHFVQPEGVKVEDLFPIGLRSAYDFQMKYWVSPPDKSRTTDIQAEYPDWFAEAMNHSDKMNILIDGGHYEEAYDYYKMLHQRRAEDQQRGGDMTAGNIIYKFIINNGTVDRLRNAGYHIAT